MNIITATPDAAAGTVTLKVTKTNAGVDIVTGILRVDANGIHPVRAQSHIFPHYLADSPDIYIPADGPLTITDYEPALSGWVEYRLQLEEFEYGEGVGASESGWTQLGGGLPRLSIPAAPAYNLTAESVIEYDAQLSARTTVHPVVGRTDPIVVQGGLSTRTGRLGIYLPSYAPARKMMALLGKGRTCLYRQAEHPGMDMYFHPQNVVNLSPETKAGEGTRWRLDVGYTEVAWPTGDRAGYDYVDYQSLRSSYSSYVEVATRFANYFDLANFEEKA